MKNLPIGIQSFEKLCEGDYLYVDKTETIHRLITSGQVFFLSRPRRFGKSLLVSTLEAIFKGQKELFDGLWIQDKVDWTQLNHPVIRIDFGQTTNTTPQELTDSLFCFLTDTASKYDIILGNTGLPSRFSELIAKLHQSTGRQVVVLIDEYDKAILDNMSNTDVMQANKEVLHGFYQVLKATDEHLRFVFLTGVSKFAGVSIFSGLNNLRDITLLEEYTTICGYTQAELEHYFSEYLPALAKHVGMTSSETMESICRWYDGYSWDGKTAIYNPFSTLLIFANKEFGNYWFNTGTPTFLIKLLMQRDQLSSILEPIVAEATEFNSFDPQEISEIPLLFQTGYLTIKHKELIEGVPQYTLEMPNREVKESLLQYLLNAYSRYPVGQESALMRRMQKQLLDNDAVGLEKSLREMLANIPYQLHIGKEAYYHSLLLLWLKLLGFDVAGEVNTNKGRIDAVWKIKECMVIAEVKFQVQEENISALLDKAIKQIKEKHYAERFDDGASTGSATESTNPVIKKVLLLGVAFAGKEIGCRMEEL
ncbi:ATPase AAA [Bacteroidia bacterium]|nr:ATPase AAA [Bacteroidia bacterium]